MTMDRLYWPLMECESVDTPCCAVCGKVGHLERHHMVFRSAGELWRDGRKLEKPTITLCGHGNADGCHGLAHRRRLHFRGVEGRVEYLLTDRPTQYADALELEGWRPLPEVCDFGC